jgi:lipopolysaccharide/colanic/teichoic acid biosynthesis glycosyltransferase
MKKSVEHYIDVKRTFDILISLLGLIFFSPVFIVVSILIKNKDCGPVFYRGVRVGKYGELIRLFKFRTMVVDAEKIGGSSTAEDDPRITKVGKYLRRYKLDELPQLINVLKGEMSIAGPRPEVQHYVDLFTEEEQAILSVRPGMTDWASLWNSDEGKVLAGSPDPDKSYMEKIRPTKLKLQLKYIKEQSFPVDLKIILQTVGYIFRKMIQESL